MLDSIFVTSPSRAAGKTLVALALVRRLRKLGRRAIGLKPVDTGCPPGPDHDLGSVDGKLLQRVSGPPDVPFTVVAPYRFATIADTPAEAFERTGLSLELGELAEVVQSAAEYGDLAIIEGATTATTKILRTSDELDLAAALGARLMIVADDEAEAEALSALAGTKKIPLLGVVISRGSRPKPREAWLWLPVLEGDLEARVLATEEALERSGLLSSLRSTS